MTSVFSTLVVYIFVNPFVHYYALNGAGACVWNDSTFT